MLFLEGVDMCACLKILGLPFFCNNFFCLFLVSRIDYDRRFQVGCWALRVLFCSYANVFHMLFMAPFDS